MRTSGLLLLIFILCGVTSRAQFNENPILNLQTEDQKFLNWGYFLGINQYGFKFDYITDNPTYPADNENYYILDGKTIGFNVGLIGEMRINNHLDLRLEPGLYYTQRDLGFQDQGDIKNYLRKTNSTYVHLPLLLKVSTLRLGNFKPYVTGGLSTSINLSSKEDSPDDNSSGNFRMKKHTYYYEMGFGVDLYFYYFKFSPSIRGVFALTDELVRDADPASPWTSNIEGMYSRAVFINFTFE